MVGAAAIDANPFELLLLAPVGKAGIGAGVHDHVAHFVAVGLVPAKMVVAGVDDEDVAFAHFHALLDHFRRVDIIIAADSR